MRELKIQQLEKVANKLRREAFDRDKKEQMLKAEIKKWRGAFELEKNEREFLHRAALDAKRKNKLLKLAIGKLQIDFDLLQNKLSAREGDLEFMKSLNKNLDNMLALTKQEETEADANTFLTKVDSEIKPRNERETIASASVDSKSNSFLPSLAVPDPLSTSMRTN